MIRTGGKLDQLVQLMKPVLILSKQDGMIIIPDFFIRRQCNINFDAVDKLDAGLVTSDFLLDPRARNAVLSGRDRFHTLRLGKLDIF